LLPKINESPDTTRTALSARAADIGEHRKTENELPPPHTHLWPHVRQCYRAAKKADRACVRIESKAEASPIII
jgi:hypothetical protein